MRCHFAHNSIGKGKNPFFSLGSMRQLQTNNANNFQVMNCKSIVYRSKVDNEK